MTRRSIGDLKRARIFVAGDEVCHICKFKIDASKERWEVEHVKPLWLGGADDETNMRPAHVHCHAGKTAEEATPRAKTNRLIVRRVGIKKPRKITSWRRFDGSIVHATRDRS